MKVRDIIKRIEADGLNFLLLIGLLGSFAGLAAGASTLSTSHTVDFEARAGHFISHCANYSLSVDFNGVTLAAHDVRLRIRLESASLAAQLEGIDPTPARANYLFGRRPAASYELFRKVRSRGIYPGIDMIFHGDQVSFEYDFAVAPGIDPRQISLAFSGLDHMRITQAGDLLLSAAPFEFRQAKPVAYQIIDGAKKTVTVAYRIDAARRVRLRVGSFDHRYPLTIDPTITFDRTFGGAGSTYPAAIAQDKQGNLYVTGQTNSADFPTVNAAQNNEAQAPLLISSDGGQTWTAQRLGAGNGASQIAAAPSQPSSVYAATNAGVWVSQDGGITWTFPLNSGLTAPLNGVAVDAGSPVILYASSTQGVFVSNDAGNHWTPSNNGIDTSPYVAHIQGITASPITPGTVFAGGQPIYRSTDSGRNWTSINRYVFQIAFDPKTPGTQYAVSDGLSKSIDNGDTWTDLGIFNAAQIAIDPQTPSNLYISDDIGVMKSSDGGASFQRVLGGLGRESANLWNGFMAVDPRNPAVVYTLSHSTIYRSVDAGATWMAHTVPVAALSALSALFVSPANSRILVGTAPTTDIFVSKWSPDGSQLLYSTYLGGTGNDSATALTIDPAGSVYVTGWTSSTDFPVASNAIQNQLATATSTYSAPANAFVTKLSPDGSQIIYSTLLGGGADQGNAIAVDSSGSAVVTGSTLGGFPLTANAIQTKVGPSCTIPGPWILTVQGAAFVARLSPDGGSLVYSTLLGNSCSTSGNGVAILPDGEAWIVGVTSSSSPASGDFPVTSGALQGQSGGSFDGFLVRFDPTGNLLYATYAGGPNYDAFSGLQLDDAGNLYLTGSSARFSQPASAGAYRSTPSLPPCGLGSIAATIFYPAGDFFVMKLDPKASQVMALTYLGAGTCSSPQISIAVDASGSPWIAGAGVFSSYPPTISPLQLTGTGFISRFSPDLTGLLFSSAFDSIAGLALSNSGAVSVVGPALNTQQFPAYLARLDPTPPAISLATVAGVGVSGFFPIAPGEVLHLTGTQLGPQAVSNGVIDPSGLVQSAADGVQATFDGVAAPLLSVGANEIRLVAPFGLAGRTSTLVQVRCNGTVSNAVAVPVSPTSVNVLAVLNDDFTPNSTANPAKPGSTMTLYISGVGQTNPPSQDGQINEPPYAQAATPVQVWIGGTEFEVTYAGSAPGLVAGILQVNFVAPQTSTPNLRVQLGSAINGSSYFNLAIQ